MRWMDVPPVWLIAFAALAWLQAKYLKLGLSLEGGLTDLLSGVLIGGGILMAVLAVVEFRRHKTTVIPHETPSSMVQSGIYKRSRNPIYVGDVLILAGLILRFDAVLSPGSCASLRLGVGASVHPAGRRPPASYLSRRLRALRTQDTALDLGWSPQ